MISINKTWGRWKFKAAEIARLYLPGDDGTPTRITATADDINDLNLTTRKFTVYSAVALAVGELLHISGYNAANNVFVVEKADADGKPAQLIAAETNEGSETSLAADIQALTGLNTLAATVGDPVYLSGSAGSWTLTAPAGPDQIKQIVGRVKVKSASVGIIVFNTVKAEIVSQGTSSLQPGTIRQFKVYSAGALVAGELLHIASYNASNDIFVVEKADADQKPAQLIAAEANAGSAVSLAVDMATLTAQNTNAASVGDPVYLDATTAGGWTLTAPAGANQIAQIVGRVKVKSETVGEIVFNLVRMEIVAIGSGNLQAGSVLKTKLAGGFLKYTLAAGTDTGANVTVTGMAVGDELISVVSFATAASIATLADRTSEYVVGAGVLTKSTGTDERNNQLAIIWLDLT